MSTTDPREWLTAAQDRVDANQACARCSLPKREHRMGYAASRCTFITFQSADSDKSAMVAALLAVLELLDDLGLYERPSPTAIRRAITDHLKEHDHG